MPPIAHKKQANTNAWEGIRPNATQAGTKMTPPMSAVFFLPIFLLQKLQTNKESTENPFNVIHKS